MLPAFISLKPHWVRGYTKG